jgi:hypothetical protein
VHQKADPWSNHFSFPAFYPPVLLRLAHCIPELGTSFDNEKVICSPFSGFVFFFSCFISSFAFRDPSFIIPLEKTPYVDFFFFRESSKADFGVSEEFRDLFDKASLLFMRRMSSFLSLYAGSLLRFTESIGFDFMIVYAFLFS